MKNGLRVMLLSALVLFCVTGAHAQNLLTNPDFETGLAGWSIWNAPPSMFWDATWIHSNDCDIWVPPTCPYGGAGISHAQKKGSGAGNAHGGLYQTIAVQPGRQYLVSGVWSGGVTGNVDLNNGTWWEVVAYDGAVTDLVIDQAPGPQDQTIAKIDRNNLGNGVSYQFGWQPFSGVFTAQSGTVTLALKTGSYYTHAAAGYHDDLSVVLLAQPSVIAMKTWALQTNVGVPGIGPGDTIRYTVVVSNPADADALDVTAAQFADTPGAGTTLVSGSVTTTQGTVTSGNGGGDTSIAIDIGTLADGASVTITFDVTIDNAIPPGTSSVSNQGFVTGANIAQTATDDPSTAAPGDATVVPLFVQIPAISDLGLLLLAMLIASAGIWKLRA